MEELNEGNLALISSTGREEPPPGMSKVLQVTGAVRAGSEGAGKRLGNEQAVPNKHKTKAARCLGREQGCLKAELLSGAVSVAF